MAAQPVTFEIVEADPEGHPRLFSCPECDQKWTSTPNLEDDVLAELRQHDCRTTATADGQDLTLGVYAVLPLDQLHPAPDNPRKNLGDLTDMAASIKAIGIVEPLVVRPDGDRYMIVCGHRRHAAAAKAGVDRVPCVVRALEDLERHKLMLQENMQRSSLTALEEAEAFAKIAALGVKQRDLAKEVGCSQPTVSKRLALLALPDNAKEALDSGRISIEQAAALARLHDQPARVRRVLEATPANRDWTLKNQLDEDKHDRARIKAIADLEAAGVPIRDSMRGIDMLGVDYGVMVDIEAHAAEPCHAANVGHAGDIKYLCTDRDRHRPEGDSQLKASNLTGGQDDDDLDLDDGDFDASPAGDIARASRNYAAEAEARRVEKEQRLAASAAAAERRRAYITSLFETGADLYSDRVLLAAHAVEASEVEWDTVPLAARFLGWTDLADVDDQQVDVWDEWESRTRGIEGDELVRAGSAIALADADLRLGGRYSGGDWTSARARRHIEWLTLNGYELDEYEQQRIAEAAAQAAPRSCRQCGCTDDYGCDGGCSWVEDDLCSACQQTPPAGPEPAEPEPAADDTTTVSADADQDLSDDEEAGVGAGRPDFDVTVSQAGKKWKVVCSACGEVGRNTTRIYADGRADDHRNSHQPQPDPAGDLVTV